MTGRTTWWACDAAEHDRELTVELGEEYGSTGPYLLRVMKDLAQQQRHDGAVRTGFRSLARKVFCDPAEARTIIEHAARIGALDELSIDEDGRRFTCRISGWKADQGRGREAMKKALQRSGDNGGLVPPEGDTVPPEGDTVPPEGDTVPPEGDVSPKCPPTRPDQTNNSTAEPTRLDEARDRLRSEDIEAVFDGWVESTGRTGRTRLDDKRRRLIRNALKSYPLDDVLAAVRGWRHSPHHRGENERSTVYNDIELLLRDGAHIEKFRDLEDPSVSGPRDESPRERSARFNAAYQNGAA